MCGIGGEVVFHKQKVHIARRARNSGIAINYRGNESAGISITDGVSLRTQKGYGEFIEAVPTIWTEIRKGLAAIFQNRYSTTGGGVCQDIRGEEKPVNPLIEFEDMDHPPIGLANCQPFFLDYRNKEDLQIRIALVHNGNLTNLTQIRNFLIKKGKNGFITETDTELIIQLIVYYLENQPRKYVRNEHPVVTAIRATMKKIKGAYSCLLLTNQGIFAFRDPRGIRPLKMAQTSDSYIFASEPIAWHGRDAEFLGNISPGEIVEARIGSKKLRFHVGIKPQKRAFCIFEDIYLQAGYNEKVSLFRKLCGIKLFELHPHVGITIPILNSGEMASLGYDIAQRLTTNNQSFYFPALYKNLHVGRTFLEPDAEDRIKKNKKKYFLLFKTIESEIRYLAETYGVVWLIFIDDSLVRSNVSRTLIKITRQCLKEIFPDIYKKIKIAWLLASPPYTHPCYYGVDTYDLNELIAARFNSDTEKIRRSINASYVGYLPVEDTLEIAAKIHDLEPSDFCAACFTGNYPVKINPEQTKMCLTE